MANNADGSVAIEVNMDVSDAEKELARLKKRVYKLEEELTVKRTKRSALVQALSAANAEMDKLKARGTKDKDGYTVYSDKDKSRMDEIQSKINEITKQLNRQKESIHETDLALEGVKIRYGDISQVAAAAAEAERAAAQAAAKDEQGGAESAAEQVESRMERICNSIKELWDEGFQSIKLGLYGIADSIKNAFSGAFKLAKKGLSGIASLAGKAAKSLLSLKKKTGGANSNFASGIKTILKYSLGIRSLWALVKKLRSALVDGFKNLAQFSSETNKSISAVLSALTQLKNSLATAFAPILTVVSPILTKFINMLSTAADYVARLTAALTGKTTYTRAKKVQEDYAESLKETGSAADDAAGSLAGFDEITSITTEDSKSGGSAAISDMFEDVAIEPLQFDSWGEALSSALDKIINDGIPKLKSAFSSAASWVNSFSSDLYNALTFPGVYEKVVLLGAELANALNGLVNQIDWATIGGALGAGLNLALEFLVSFIWTFDWMELGASIADLFNNAIAEIDWYNVGMLLWSKFKIAIETLAGFLVNLDMSAVAAAISNIVIGLFDSITETLADIDWQKLGNQIAVLVTEIDWSGVVASLFETFGAALGAGARFLWGLIEDAWDDVMEWWHDAAFEDGEFTIGGLLDGILEGVKNIGTWILDNIAMPIINGVKKTFGIASPSTVMKELGGYVMEGLLEGIVSLVSSVVNAVTGVWELIKRWWNKNVKQYFTLSYWKDLGSTIIDGLLQGLKNAWKSVTTWVSEKVSWITSKFSKAKSSAGDTSTFSSGQSGGGRVSVQSASISVADIPALASGSVIPRNREFLAVLGDNKRETEVVSPLSTMKQAFLEALQESGGGNQTMEVKLYLDGKQIARNNVKHINDMTMAAGKPVLLF